MTLSRIGDVDGTARPFARGPLATLRLDPEEDDEAGCCFERGEDEATDFVGLAARAEAGADVDASGAGVEDTVEDEEDGEEAETVADEEEA